MMTIPAEFTDLKSKGNIIQRKSEDSRKKSMTSSSPVTSPFMLRPRTNGSFRLSSLKRRRALVGGRTEEKAVEEIATTAEAKNGSSSHLRDVEDERKGCCVEDEDEEETEDELSKQIKVATGYSSTCRKSSSPYEDRQNLERWRRRESHGITFPMRSDSDSGFEYDVPTPPMSHQLNDSQIRRVDFEREYDIVQKIGEGWFSRVYLSEHRHTREEIVIKAINSKKVTAEEFLREYEHAYKLSAHKNVVTVYDVVFRSRGYYMFAAEYAPLGDLTSNVISERGIGETAAKRVAKQIGSALEWVHDQNLCHLDVKLDNILVFKSDFSKVKLCDFGSVRTQGDIVIKKNELLPYCPPELVARHANEYYQVDRVQDAFQFGIVVFFCLFGILPWQRADTQTDPNFGEFYVWRNNKKNKKKSGNKIPKNFKSLTSKSQKFFRKLLDPDPERRMSLCQVSKYTQDRWIRKKSLSSCGGQGGQGGGQGQGGGVGGTGFFLLRPNSSSVSEFFASESKMLSDGISQLTMGSFQSVHSNVVEKNRVLRTLLQHGVETTVDRTHKNSRIIRWIQNSKSSEHISSTRGLHDDDDASGDEDGDVQKRFSSSFQDLGFT